MDVDDAYNEAKHRNLIRITAELNASKNFLNNVTAIPDDEDTFVGFATVFSMRVYTALRTAWLCRVPDDILARLLLVAHHQSFREGPALMFNWESVQNGTEEQELDRCEFSLRDALTPAFCV